VFLWKQGTGKVDRPVCPGWLQTRAPLTSDGCQSRRPAESDIKEDSRSPALWKYSSFPFIGG
jgi:hypothetical protein